jgi:hypothetical protein
MVEITSIPAHKRLDIYLRELAACPNEMVANRASRYPKLIHKLEAEYGVHDNFPIMLQGDPETVIQGLVNTGQFIRGTENRDKLLFSAGTVIGIIHPANALNFTGRGYVDMQGLERYCTPEMRAHYAFQKERFNMELRLHPYNSRKMPGVCEEQVLSLAIQEVGSYALLAKIPLCMPSALGTNHEKDFSRTVYHIPCA